MKILAPLILILLTYSCADETAFMTDRAEQKESSDLNVRKISTADQEVAQPIFHGLYSIKVDAENGTEVCDGTFHGTLWSDQVFVPDEGETMKCLLKGDIDLANSFPRISSVKREDLPMYGSVVRREDNPDVDGISFSPAKLQGFALVQDHNEFKFFEETESYDLIYSDEDGDQYDQGEYTLRTLATHGSMSINSGEIFSNVFNYELEKVIINSN